MNTVIASDRVGRFAEIDHAVVEELQAIVETAALAVPSAAPIPARPGLLARFGATLRASIPLSRRS